MDKRIILVIGVVGIALVGLIFFSKRGPSVSPSPTPTELSSVPLPRSEDIVSTFINLIGEKRIPEAVSMLTPKAISDESQKQAWGVQFNAFQKISLKALESAGDNLFKVTLNVEMKPESANNPIPYYGYTNGDNIRWIGVEKIDGLYKITGIATGP